ncbi:alpha/beta hydrolase [Pseudomonas alcaligenes]|uniref:Alpha/beta hydrolase n=1 Tax=Aquipseudomonas alcaligenes TaxID=43263 RepID=A0ABR7S3G7_AQUAC|nr:alpha/beta fold hydrolase [Pseudomonas alcaligenes]MBC9250933.1 alpha/beta hydrolase [Pseudomonas alcaligenes]
MPKRSDVRFPSADGASCGAWLYLPDATKPAPIIVMGHGLGSVRTMRLEVYAERFQAAGYACLVFDYRHFGDSDGLPRQLLDVKKQLQDWKAAVAYARSLKEVDGNQVIIWGTSFGGGHVLATAADDPQISAVIAQCPFTDGPASALAGPMITSLKVTNRALLDKVLSWFGAKPLFINIAGTPGSLALMTSWDALPGYMKLVPPSGDFTNHVAARIALQILPYMPGRAARRIAAPVLYCICEKDTVTPADAAVKHARRTPNREIKLYNEGHFDIYVGGALERVLQDQLEFLGRVVPTQRGER